jgi:hypothetical protein
VIAMGNTEKLPDLAGTLDDLYGSLRIVENLIANPPFLDAGYLGSREHGIHIRRMKLLGELARREIARIEGTKAAKAEQQDNADERRKQQRYEADQYRAKDAGLSDWAIAEKMRDPQRRGWSQMTIYRNISAD